LATIDMGQKVCVGATVPLSVGRGAGSPSNTMSPGPRPTSIPSGILIHSTVWPQYTNVTDRQTDRTNRQRSDGIGRTVQGESFYKRSPKCFSAYGSLTMRRPCSAEQCKSSPAELTWNEVFVGDADRAQGVVCHGFDEVRDHFFLIVLRELPRLAIVSDDPRTPGQVKSISNRCRTAATSQR